MSFQILKNAFRETLRSYGPFLKNVLILMTCMALPFGFLEQYIFQTATQSEDRTLNGILGVTSAVIEIFFIQIALGYGAKRLSVYSRSLSEHYQAYLKDFIIETLRSFGKIALWSLALLIPGIYRWIQYSLINYVVQFDEAYARGEVDSLARCHDLLKGRFLPYALIFILTQAVIFGIQFYGMRFVLSVNPFEWFLNFFVDIFLSAFFYLLFFQYYKQLQTDLSKR